MNLFTFNSRAKLSDKREKDKYLINNFRYCGISYTLPPAGSGTAGMVSRIVPCFHQFPPGFDNFVGI